MIVDKRILVGKGTSHSNVIIEVRVVEKKKRDTAQKTVDLKPAPQKYTTLSCIGEGSDYWGQCQQSIRKYIPSFELNIPKEQLLRILEVWDEWHLNDMEAGTKLQEEILVKHYGKKKRGYTYVDACNVLKKEGLYVDRGYKYGSAWLLRILPEEIIEEIKTW
jgi:hypothetical protein